MDDCKRCEFFNYCKSEKWRILKVNPCEILVPSQQKIMDKVHKIMKLYDIEEC